VCRRTFVGAQIFMRTNRGLYFWLAWIMVWTGLSGCGAPVLAQVFPEDGAPAAVEWKQLVRLTVTRSGLGGSTLSREAATSVPAAWNGVAVGRRVLPGDGRVLFRFATPDRRMALGFSVSERDLGTARMPYSIRSVPGRPARIQIWEGSVQRPLESGVSPDLQPEQVYEIRREAGVIRYFRDGQLICVSPVPSQEALMVDAAIVDRGGQLADVRYLGYQSPEDVEWASPSGVFVGYGTGGAGTGLKRTLAGTGSGAGAVGARAVFGDGGIRFRFEKRSQAVAAGLFGVGTAFSAGGFLEGDLVHGLRTGAGGVYEVVESGVVRWSSVQPWVPGDLFGIERQNGTVVYLKNGVTFYESTAPAMGPLGIGVGLGALGSGVQGGQMVGGSRLEPVSWTVAETLAVRHSPFGTGVTCTALSIHGGVVNLARSDKMISEQGRVEFRFAQADRNAVLGLGQPDSDLYAIRGRADGQWQIEEAGVPVGVQGAYAPGDVFGIRRVAGRVEYLWNGTVMRSVTDSGGGLLIRATLNSVGAGLADCLASGLPENLLWRNVAGAVPGVGLGAGGVPGLGGTLVRGGAAPKWNAGAIGSRMWAGDGEVRFRFLAANRRALLGLSESDASRGTGDLKVAFYGNAGQLMILVGGVAQTNPAVGTPDSGSTRFGVYTATDSFWIRRRGTEISFWKNGVRIYTHLRAARVPLWVDSSLYDKGAGFADCQVLFRDGDSDGLEDAWEAEQFGHLDRGSSLDLDEDGVTELEEFLKDGDPAEAPVDGDGDGLSDVWELREFGGLQAVATQDDDGDGASNAYEYRHGSDPLDRYNGSVPALELAGGNRQEGEPGALLEEFLEIVVRDPEGQPIGNGPVAFSVVGGGGGLFEESGTVSGGGAEFLALRTGAEGRVRVRYRIPNAGTASHREVHRIRVGARSRRAGYVFQEFVAYPGEVLEFSDLNVWVKADAGVELSGGGVQLWRDQSGNGNHAGPLPRAAAGTRPTLGKLGGVSVLNFDGVDDRLTWMTETGQDSFTVVAAVAATATTVAREQGTAYGMRESGVTGQSYLLAGEIPRGASPWPKLPAQPARKRISLWENRARVVGEGSVEVYLPLAGLERLLGVDERYRPVDKRYDVTNGRYFDAARNAYVQNPLGGRNQAQIQALWVEQNPVYRDWNLNTRFLGAQSYSGQWLDAQEKFYEVTPTSWKLLTPATEPNADVLEEVAVGVSVGKNGVAAFDLRSEYAPAAAALARSPDSGLRVVTVRYQGRRPSLFDNGVAGSGGPSQISLARSVRGPRYLGGPGIRGNFFKGSLAELLVFDRALSETERRSVENYLAERHGLAALDRDQDRIPDFFEWRWFEDQNATGEMDSDGDGVSNADEYLLGLNPVATDSDQDGLSDGIERNHTGTDPAAWDTDGDGYPDGYEVARGADPKNPANGFVDGNGDGSPDGYAFWNTYRPGHTDSNGDGIVDLEEIRQGRNPFSPTH
jgi:hypothetical protein